MILDNGNSNDTSVKDETKGASGNIDIECIKQDASLYNTFIISKLAFKSQGMPFAFAQSQY
jgi:hypothetical protein